MTARVYNHALVQMCNDARRRIWVAILARAPLPDAPERAITQPANASTVNLMSLTYVPSTVLAESRVSRNYHINNDEELISIHISGDETLTSIDALFADLAADLSHVGSWPHLVDLRGLNLEEPHEQAVPFLKRMVGHYRPFVDADMAIVADMSLPPQIFQNLFRLTCAMPQTELFDDYSTAIKWLIQKDFTRSAEQSYGAAN